MVDLPEFMEEPKTITTVGPSADIAARASCQGRMRWPDRSARVRTSPSRVMRPTGSRTVAGSIPSCFSMTREAMPPAATRFV